MKKVLAALVVILTLTSFLAPLTSLTKAQSPVRDACEQTVQDLSTAYIGYQTELLSSSWWNSKGEEYARDAADILLDEITPKYEDIALLFAPEFIQTAAGALQLQSIVTLTQLFRDLLGGMTSSTIGFYLPYGDNYQTIQQKLTEININTQEILDAKSINDQVVLQAKFQQRKGLLEDLYRLMPAYLTTLYYKTIKNPFAPCIGGIYQNVYFTIRSIVEQLRLTLIADYYATTAWINDAKSDSALNVDVNAPLSIHEIDYYQSTSILYDTLDGSQDYTIYEITVNPGDVGQGQKLFMNVASPISEGLVGYLKQGTPPDPTNPTGTPLVSSPLGGSIGLNVEAVSGKYYLLVKPDLNVGPYVLQAYMYKSNWFYSYDQKAVSVSAVGKFSVSPPRPHIVSATINQGNNGRNYFEVEVHASNLGGTSEWQSIAVSLPTISDSRSIEIQSYDLDIAPQIYGAGSTVNGKYGTVTYASNYPLVEGSSQNWVTNEEKYFKIRIYSDDIANFYVYVKSVAWGLGVWSSDPEMAGTINVDQQDEFVYKVPSSTTGTQWSQTYGGTGDDEAYCVIQTSDGGYAMVGGTKSYGAGYWDFWLVKIDSSGNQQWNKTYGGTSTDQAFCVVQTLDGGYAIAGCSQSFSGGSIDFWLVKTDSLGYEQWDKTYGGTGGQVAFCVVQTYDGGYALTGISNGAGNDDFWLVKTDGLGNQQWAKTYGGANDEIARSIVQTSDGGYAMLGGTKSYGAGYWDFWLVKIDSSGNEQWDKSYGGISDDWGSSVIRTLDGGYALGGFSDSFGAGGSDFWLIKTDAYGNVKWDKTYGSTSNEVAFCVVQTSDRGYALAGWTQKSEQTANCWLVKIDSSGNEQWDRTYGGIGGNQEANCLILTSNGCYALAGYTRSYGAGGSDFWLIKTDGYGLLQITPTLSFTNEPIQIGVPFHFSGQYFAPGTQYNIYANRNSVALLLGSPTADISGEINADFTIPSDGGLCIYPGGSTGKQIGIFAEEAVNPPGNYWAYADYQPPILSVTNGPVKLGVPFHFSGQYFAPGTQYNIYVSSPNEPVSLGSILTNGSGSFSAYISIPFGTHLTDYGGGSTGHKVKIIASESTVTPPSSYEVLVEYQLNTDHSDYLMLNVNPQANYIKGQQVTLTVTVLNQLNPQLDSTLTLTITGPNGYTYYDFQPINVSANSVAEYSISWNVPNTDGKYVVEASLVPMQLTAYDAKWLQISESTSESSNLISSIIDISTNLVRSSLLIIALFASQSLAAVYTIVNFAAKLRFTHKRERYYSNNRFLCSYFGQKLLNH
jgi:hypothetical protein